MFNLKKKKKNVLLQFHVQYEDQKICRVEAAFDLHGCNFFFFFFVYLNYLMCYGLPFDMMFYNVLIILF